MLCFGLGLGLPKSDYSPELPHEGKNKEAFQAHANDKFWRVLLVFPVVINVLMLLMFLIFIRKDSIMHNLSITNINQADAMILIDKIYNTCEDRDEILYAIKTQCGKEPKKKTTVAKALFGKKYMRSTVYMMLFTTIC